MNVFCYLILENSDQPPYVTSRLVCTHCDVLIITTMGQTKKKLAYNLGKYQRNMGLEATYRH